ncbi:MAG: hypothetical protein U1E76_21575 [Planctomycetota bacterium]
MKALQDVAPLGLAEAEQEIAPDQLDHDPLAACPVDAAREEDDAHASEPISCTSS